MNINWAHGLSADMERFSPGGLYLNFPGFGEEGVAKMRVACSDTFARLQAAKSKYDPENLFRTNFDITPLANREG